MTHQWIAPMESQMDDKPHESTAPMESQMDMDRRKLMGCCGGGDKADVLRRQAAEQQKRAKKKRDREEEQKKQEQEQGENAALSSEEIAKRDAQLVTLEYALTVIDEEQEKIKKQKDAGGKYMYDLIIIVERRDIRAPENSQTSVQRPRNVRKTSWILSYRKQHGSADDAESKRDDAKQDRYMRIVFEDKQYDALTELEKNPNFNRMVSSESLVFSYEFGYKEDQMMKIYCIRGCYWERDDCITEQTQEEKDHIESEE